MHAESRIKIASLYPPNRFNTSIHESNEIYNVCRDAKYGRTVVLDFACIQDVLLIILPLNDVVQALDSHLNPVNTVSTAFSRYMTKAIRFEYL